MACTRPIKAYIGRDKTKNGKKSIVFSPTNGYLDRKLEIACGQCHWCRLERSRQWAVRCMHEASLHDDNCFITLTYDEDNIPKDGSLDKTHFQKFMKRLRKEYCDKKIRFFHCGEYGELHNRPHYHAILFGLDFDDRVMYHTDKDNAYSSSPKLAKIWKYGRNQVGDVTFESCKYVASYIQKKVLGKGNMEAYTNFDKNTGEIFREIQPEYITMSRRPGIGSVWFEKWNREVYPSDSVIINEREVRPPKYYDNLLEKKNPEFAKKIKLRRQNLPIKVINDNTPERLAVKERILEKKLKNKTRRYEND